MEVKIVDLINIYNNDIKKHYRNKKKLYNFDKNRMEYFIEMKRLLESGEYNGGLYRIFLVKEPKIRVIMSQSVFDKVINHYVARYIIIPKLSKYLNNRNCATRKNMGLSYAIKTLKNDINKYKYKYDNLYVLKIDISKYFYSIDHDVLLNMIERDFSIDEYNLIKVILNSTNRPYINKIITDIENSIGINLPRYYYNKGLSIGSMTNQFFAIFYLSKLQHFIIHNLHLKMVNYMDDYIIIHHDKHYLIKALDIIKYKLKKEYKLDINANKTFISNMKYGFVFLGYNFKLNNKKLIIRLSKNAKRNIIKGLKKNKYLISNNLTSFNEYFCSMENYYHSYPYANGYEVYNIINRLG